MKECVLGGSVRRRWGRKVENGRGDREKERKRYRKERVSIRSGFAF